MDWSMFVVFWTLIAAVKGINRPVYKVSLTQKGFVQSLQYDIQIPPLREFTFCTWVKFKELNKDQTIFSYLVFGGAAGIKLWLGSGGSSLKVAIVASTGSATSSTPVNIEKDVWRHYCFSFQSDFGAWALYLDSELLSCESSRWLHNGILPSGGTIVIGYGTSSDGASNGLEGELYGANMILLSTIGKNKTVIGVSTVRPFQKNKIKEELNANQYTVLNNLNESAPGDVPSNRTRSFIRLKTPYSFLEHDVGIAVSTNNNKIQELVNEKQSFELAKSAGSTNKNVQFWARPLNKAKKFKTQQKYNIEQFGSGSEDLITVSEYEKPPAPGPANLDYLEKGLEMEKPPTPEPFSVSKSMEDYNKLLDNEVPPPPSTNTKVYGQWINNRFAKNVLDFIKKNNIYYKPQRKVPPTIPLKKISDIFPYASNIKEYKIRPPVLFESDDFFSKRIDRQRKIVEYDLRGAILKSHAQTKPKFVDIMPRGQGMLSPEHRFHRDLQDVEMLVKPYEYKDNTSITSSGFNKINGLNIYEPSFLESGTVIEKNNQKRTLNLPMLEYNGSPSLSFLRPVSANINNTDKFGSVYLKSLSNSRNWHNTKLYEHFAPRYINMELTYNKNMTNEIKHDKKPKEISADNGFMQDKRKFVYLQKENEIQKGRALAADIIQHSSNDKVYLQDYKRGFRGLEQVKFSDKKNDVIRDNFNKRVKIGNALNERDVLGSSEDQKEKSFIGGDENIPEINKYRSDIDNVNENVPPSLGPRTCKNNKGQDSMEPLLFVLPDGSIDIVPIFSDFSVKKKMGTEFIHQNYRKCSWEQSSLGNSSFLIINWNETPVRLFGGARAIKTTDLCGFF